MARRKPVPPAAPPTGGSIAPHGILELERFSQESLNRWNTLSIEGLTAQELALARMTSHTTVFVNGSLHRVFDMTSPTHLEGIARVLGRIKMPERARMLRAKLRIASRQLWMITTGRQLYDALLTHNWRVFPVQFELPAAGHTIAELIRAAGFEAILFRSTSADGAWPSFQVRSPRVHSSSWLTRHQQRSGIRGSMFNPPMNCRHDGPVRRGRSARRLVRAPASATHQYESALENRPTN